MGSESVYAEKTSENFSGWQLQRREGFLLASGSLQPIVSFTSEGQGLKMFMWLAPPSPEQAGKEAAAKQQVAGCNIPQAHDTPHVTSRTTSVKSRTNLD